MPRGWTVPSLEMRRISCLLRLSLLPGMGQRARIFISETQWLPLLKCLATGWFASLLVTARRCSPNLVLMEDVSGSFFKKWKFFLMTSRTFNFSSFQFHLSLYDTLPIDIPSFLFFTPFCPVSHCLVLYYAIRFTFLCLHFVLTKSIWLAFILSRDVFVLTRIKTRVAVARNVDFSFIVSGSGRTFTFHDI